ncbi:sensor histidine kinase [Porphyromonas pogonae]|uniref:sensor histidine kinase n=1 Tax=Porphyromonas pogonae TaxID=867595 RepID=UPI002E76F572|nr:ATP-binding protein [Porphyromonas pogonae]
MKKSESPKDLLVILAILITAVATGVFMATREYLAGMATLIVTLALCRRIYKSIKRSSESIILLLNAIENADYSLRFSEVKGDHFSKNINKTLNRIKEILSNARQEVMNNERFLSIAIETVSTGIIIMNESGYISLANQAAHRLLSLPILTHTSQLKSIATTLPDQLNSLTEKDNLNVQIDNERESGHVSIRVTPTDIQGKRYRIFTLSNISSELEARETESWIRLIRVMTHEIMNSIAPISSISETLMQSLEDQDEKPDVDTIAMGLDTIHTTSRGLLSFVEDYRKFSSVPLPEKTEFELMMLLKDVLSLQRRTMAEYHIENIMVDVPEDFTVCADKNLLLQVLVNLVKNATEAVYAPEMIAVIRISAGIHTDGNKYIEVANNGMAIPEEVLPNIFIPFFTTKEKGSGIGLSLSRYIMRRHNGNLSHRRNGDFTVFSIDF